MNRRIASAVFETRAQAERAVTELRARGIEDRDISVIQRGHDAIDGSGEHRDDKDDKGSAAAKGAGVGAGVGALAGLAALAIPGVGPFLAMGAVAETLGVVGSAAATSAAVGAAAGGISGAMMDFGETEEDARYYDRRIHEGGIWVGVDASRSNADPLMIERLLRDAGGESAEASRASAAH